MQLLSPHCHNPIEVVALDLAHETLCPSCGSTFRLDMGSTVTWTPSEGPGTLGPYELVGMVGTGELCSVYKAHGPELDRAGARGGRTRRHPLPRLRFRRGRDPLRLLSVQQPTFREAATLAAAVADALEYVHEHGVVHREIKPSNILLDEQGKPQQPVL